MKQLKGEMQNHHKDAKQVDNDAKPTQRQNAGGVGSLLHICVPPHSSTAGNTGIMVMETRCSSGGLMGLKQVCVFFFFFRWICLTSDTDPITTYYVRQLCQSIFSLVVFYKMLCFLFRCVSWNVTFFEMFLWNAVFPVLSLYFALKCHCTLIQ